jgi:2,4'-dihydroxyacetophenone dioxygenase
MGNVRQVRARNGPPDPFSHRLGALFYDQGPLGLQRYPDDPQVAGSYLYEPGGSMHTFTVPVDATEDAEGFFVINGANLNFVDGLFQNVTDAGSLEEMLRALATATNSQLRFIGPGPAAIQAVAAA